jgi:hypothetical protein
LLYSLDIICLFEIIWSHNLIFILVGLCSKGGDFRHANNFYLMSEIKTIGWSNNHSNIAQRSKVIDDYFVIYIHF